MTERLGRPGEWLRWATLAVAVAVVVIFLVAQRQSIDVSYGRPADTADAVTPDNSAGESSDASVPSVGRMTAMLAADPVVRLPGAIAHVDEQRVRAAAGGEPVRILMAAPGLDEAEQARVRAVPNATVQIIGTEVSGASSQAVGDSLDDWRAQFATGDVTNLVVTLVAGTRDRPRPADVDALTRREPTAAELAAVLPALRRDRLYVAAGATLDLPHDAAAAAFPDTPAVYLALPQQPYGRPVPRYGPALAAALPGTPVVVLYGDWIEYDGPQGGEFAELAGATFYAQYADRLSRYAYPQGNVLGAYLDRVTDVRYSGLFDRPLPYRPVDPLRVALPALPWVFAACVLAFLVLSVTGVRRRTPGAVRDAGVPARLAGLTALALDLSAITGRDGDPGLTRGITNLTGAAEALDQRLPDRHVRGLLDRAEAELDQAARTLPYRGYRPADYLRERVT